MFQAGGVPYEKNNAFKHVLACFRDNTIPVHYLGFDLHCPDPFHRFCSSLHVFYGIFCHIFRRSSLTRMCAHHHSNDNDGEHRASLKRRHHVYTGHFGDSNPRLCVIQNDKKIIPMPDTRVPLKRFTGVFFLLGRCNKKCTRETGALFFFRFILPSFSLVM